MEKRNRIKIKDPDPIFLLLQILSAGGAIAAMITLHMRVENKKLDYSRQKAIRKQLKKQLLKLFSEFNELIDYCRTTRGYYEIGKVDIKQTSFKFGGGTLYLPSSEITRLRRTAINISKVNSKIMADCVAIGDLLQRVESTKYKESPEIVSFRVEIKTLIEKYNSSVFAKKDQTNEYLSHEEILAKIEELFQGTRNALSNLEEIMGKEYDDN